MSKAFSTKEVNGRQTSEEAANYYALTSQQDYQVEKTKKIAAAMKNPSDYYTKRAAALEGVKAESAAHFAGQYANLVKLNVPHNEAISRATALADSMRTLLMATVEDEWPADINQLSLQLESNKARAPGGYAQPDASVPTGTGRARAHKRK